jgi:hypothetical protein
MTTERIEAFWENATADDVAGIANTRKPILARVRDEDNEVWREDLISGWRLSRFLPGAVWIDVDGVHWKHCQVYREPFWHANKPDPGPGYRLLGKFPDEEPKPGDECFGVSGEWGPSCQAKAGGHQVFGMWYRRRIEPVEPIESKPVLIRRRVVEIGDEIKLPNGRVLVFNGEGFEVAQ